MSRPSAARLAHDLARAMPAALLDALLRPDAVAAGTAMAVPRAATAGAPAWLAGHHPGGAAAQAQARALYERCLAYYREHVCEKPQSADDAGVVLARFVAANLEALHATDLTPARLDRLAQQMRAVLHRSPAWRGAALRERQSYVEQLAIVGVLVHETAAQAVLEGPAAVDHVCTAARGYLMQLLGLDADRLAVTDDGLALADTAPALAA